ncbi:MAG: sodium-translocating pyrophosphatase [Phycisphaerae bacterium]|nr:sodium-translocating pyrophosphatase [Phycisphaerae bacterium]
MEPALAQAPSVGQPAAELSTPPSSEGEVVSVATSSHIPLVWWLAPICGIIALWSARGYYNEVKNSSEGDPDMIRIAGYVREGAMAYLFRQYRVVAVVFVFLIGILSWMAYSLHVQHGLVPWAFLTGGFFSGLCGYIGMRTATIAAHRTTAGARESLNQGLRVAFRAGAVMGLVVVGFALIDITVWFGVLRIFTEMSLHEITVVMLTFGMGASTQALFARVGGGIYTKAADVGADLVGKVEAGIPEDDPRNPAAIADNVGDNVGDVAGMGADLYESYAGSILATAALGVAAAYGLANATQDEDALRFLVVPMVVAGAGIIASIWAGINLVRTEEGATMAQLMSALNKGLLSSSVVILILTYVICYFLLGSIEHVNWFGVASAVTVGLAAGWLIGKSTEFFTSYDFLPTRRIAEQAQTGPATVIIAGVAEGMRSTWASLFIIIVAIMASFIFAGGKHEFMLGLYGVGLAAVGMLSTLGFTLATDAYGPIADNAGGNAEMTGQAPEVRERTDALDSLGNTTAATGKGFAIGSAALTALALLAAYVEEVRIGVVRESMAYVQVVDDKADEVDNAALGTIYYMGYGKFASKTEPGTKESAYDAYFLMSDKVRPVLDELLRREGSTGMASVTLQGELTDPDPAMSNIQKGYIVGSQGKRHEVELVSARKASLQQYMDYYDVTLMNPQVLCGMFAGVLLVFLFCALTMQAVGRAAFKMMLECREQFRHVAEYLVSTKGMSAEDARKADNWPRGQVVHNGQKIPDYARCVDISTAGAQREMIFPSMLAIIVPVLVGLVFGVGGVMGLLAGGLTSGFAVAIFMANAGGAWDNAKKYVEKGHYGGKGSEAHKATVVGDTVGDPFKDTSGPSLNILIKLMSMVSVVFAGLVVKYAPQVGAFLGLG